MPPNDACPTPTSDESPVEPVSALLERLSFAVVTAINEQDFDFTSEQAHEFLAHLAPDWEGEMDTQPAKVNFEQQVALWRQRTETHPNVCFEVLQVESAVDEDSGTASVYLGMQVSGFGDVVLHAMNEMKWRREKSKGWLCYQTIGMRGSMVNSGGLG